MHLMRYRFTRDNALFCVGVFMLASFIVSVSHVSLSASDAKRGRKISIYNIHTKKTLRVVYKRDGRYIPTALTKINEIMGDWRRKTSTKMDPKLIDLMWELHTELGSRKPIYLISGYRSLKTNNMLRKTRGGQARRSRHILGKAADVHFPDVSVRRLRNSAMIRQLGGVGYYPTSAIPFVHLDTGRVRHWPRMRRLELAALFPSGRSRHIPRDGKPITKNDHRIAMAKLNARQKASIRLAHAWLKKPRGKKGGGRPATHHRFASLGTPLLPSGKNKQPASAVLSSWNSKSDSGRSNALRNRAKLQLASLTPEQKPEPYLRGRGGNQGGLTGRSDVSLSSGWASAPAYDEEHPDDLSYSPFPILPLMKDKSISYDVDVMAMRAPEHDNEHYLFGEPEQMIPLQFRHGLQFAEMLWASDFKGKAVIDLTDKTPKYPDHYLKALKERDARSRVAKN